MFIIYLSNDATFQLKSRVDLSKFSSNCRFYAAIIDILVLVMFINDKLKFVSISSLNSIFIILDELKSVILALHYWLSLSFIYYVYC